MAPIPSTLWPELLHKYEYRCSYCHRPIGLDDYAYFESDHIVPASKKGTDDLKNRAPACRECNLRKSNKTEWADPETKSIVSLYNPGTNEWNNHFTVSELTGVIIGKSPEGRATVDLLGLNKRVRDEKYLFRGNPILLLDDKELLSQISLLRYLRLCCDYENVLNLGKLLFIDERTVSSKHRLEAQLAIATQIIETFFTRCRDKHDVLNGIRWTLYFRKYFALSFPERSYDHRVFGNFGSFVKKLTTG